MGQNTVVVAILVGALIIAAAIYLRPTEFDACMKGYADAGYDHKFATAYCDPK
jgi:hypothetical protein